MSKKKRLDNFILGLGFPKHPLSFEMCETWEDYKEARKAHSEALNIFTKPMFQNLGKRKRKKKV